MKKTVLMLGTVALAGLMPMAAQAQENLSKADVEKIIGEFLKANPEILIESLENYRVQKEQEQQAASQDKINRYQSFFTEKTAPSVGSASPDVTVVEFFDYNCGYCRRAVPDIQELVKEDSNVRFVFREMPILSPNSNEVAKWALAAHKQDKYFDFHVALMDFRGTRDAGTMKKLAKNVGLDAEKLEKDANSPQVAAELEKSLSVAHDIGIQGTPAFIINGQLYPGYLGPEGLKQAILAARQKL